MFYHITSQKVPLQSPAKNKFSVVFEAAVALFSFYFFKQIVIRANTMAQFSYHVDGHVYILYLLRQTENVKTGSDSSTAKCLNTSARSANHGSKEGISIRQLSFPKQKNYLF